MLEEGSALLCAKSNHGLHGKNGFARMEKKY